MQHGAGGLRSDVPGGAARPDRGENEIAPARQGPLHFSDTFSAQLKSVAHVPPLSQLNVAVAFVQPLKLSASSPSSALSRQAAKGTMASEALPLAAISQMRRDTAAWSSGTVL